MGRVTTDRPDDNLFDQVRVMYVVPLDGLDRAFDTDGKICNSARAFATWFHAQAPDAYVRFDTFGSDLDIGFVRLPLTDAVMRGNDPDNNDYDTGTAFVRERIERELSNMGLIASNKLYAVYYDGSSVYACGGGAWPPEINGRVGAVYLQGKPPNLTVTCGDARPWGQSSLVPSYVDYSVLHETVHSLGFVSQDAPHEQGSGHVYDGTADSNRDLMYSPRVGQNDPPWAIDDPAGMILDINHDDYFMAAGGRDLAKSSLLAPLPAGAARPSGW
jgi:hypothetical protein